MGYGFGTSLSSIPAETIPPHIRTFSTGEKTFHGKMLQGIFIAYDTYGEEVRVSTAIMTASLVRKPRELFPKAGTLCSVVRSGKRASRNEGEKILIPAIRGNRKIVAEFLSCEIDHTLRGGSLTHISLLPADLFQFFLETHHG